MLAAAYAFGLAKNHAFVDGNKRIAFMTMVVFLRKNGIPFAPDQAQSTAILFPRPARSAKKAWRAGSETIGRRRDGWLTPPLEHRRMPDAERRAFIRNIAEV